MFAVPLITSSQRESVMSLITVDLLKVALPDCKKPEEWVAALIPALEKYAINSEARVASFLTQYRA
ncbi:hypothetical protein CT1752 [Chlorobaculum tepidum TLS]|uniref:Uncharacterized protein n=2 Tax=Chlorobaculum tepidum TaxID=1097 RepID=Q8KBN4_CHLTE|nr:hypothetical protein CT1752 [Chlorobaculum tepidum TLS]